LNVNLYWQTVEILISERGRFMDEAGWDFQKIHDEYRPRIRLYLARLVGEFEAEDLTQEVFLRISRSLQSFRGEAQLQTWIYRIATNAAVDRLRAPSYKYAAASALDPDAEMGEDEIEDRDLWTGEPAPSLEEQVFRNEGLDCYCDFIEQLPENYRLVVALNQLGELTAREIAEALGLSLEAVKIRLHRGRARLLQELKAHCKAEDWL
jgi:RNA polymerase sigma-70 factor (ECF subfamily)